ncbi:hypothetical protein R1sor_019126 [Riccia sorocarpa]|uniref:Uncharacterized protein n=1 Tax=Riccia sorocarpa TaxID=122646 RepID=A0ABD3IHU8_9MARC
MAGLTELRSSLEALELEQVKAENAALLEVKARLEKEYGLELSYSESLRQSVDELNRVQERMAFENSELKRALQEATDTTGTLKEVLEEKASELSAWLGMDGINLQAIPSSVLENSFPLNVSNQEPLSALAWEDFTSRISDTLARIRSQSADGNIGSSDMVDEGLEARPNGALEGDSANIKEEVASEQRSLTVELESSSHDSFTRKQERISSLEQKIHELQLELDGLREQQVQSKDDIELWVFKQRSSSSGPTEVAGDHAECEGRLSSDSSSTTEKAEIISLQHRSSSGDVAGTSSVHEIAPSPELQLDNERPSGPLQSRALEGSPSGYEPEEVIWVNSQTHLEDKHVYTSAAALWSEKSVSELVESITEELTKLLTVEKQMPGSSSLRQGFNDLEERMKDWSSITSKTLLSKISTAGALEEWKGLVVDFLSRSRQELMTLQQRLHDCEEELSSIDKLRAESLSASQTIAFLRDEINKLEAQNFDDNVEREEEYNLLKKELDHAHSLIAAAQKRTVEDHKSVLLLKEQLREVELELEHSKQGYAAEQDFIDACFGQEGDGSSHYRKDAENLRNRVEELSNRLEENERELGELMVISGIDVDAVVAAQFKRMEQRLEDAKAAEALSKAEKQELASQITWLKAKLAEVEHELHLENQQHIESLIRYEEDQGQFEAAVLSERAALNARVAHLEKLLAEKSRQLEIAHHMLSSKAQALGLRTSLLGLENGFVNEWQSSRESDPSNKMDGNVDREGQLVASLTAELSEAEQREKRAQSQIERLMLELGIAKEEVLKCEVRMQKIIRQAKEDVEIEKRRLEESQNSQKQMEWHLCRQMELTEGLEREKGRLREILQEFELQNLALEKQRDDLRTAYMQLAKQTAQRAG